MMSTDIVMVTWQRKAITEVTIRAIKRNTYKDSYRLIVIDNGSSPDMQDMLKQMRDDGFIHELVLNETNRGLEPARNQGLLLVNSPFVVMTDNDCLPMPRKPTKDWLQMMLELMQKYEDMAAISARTQVMIGTGNIFEMADEVGDDIVEFPHPGGSLRIMDTAAVRAVGGWREDSLGRGAEERYICGKLREEGYKTAFATHVRCLHLFGVRENNTDRWGYPADWKPEQTGHSDIWHPSLANGDDYEDVKQYVGEEYADDYFSQG